MSHPFSPDHFLGYVSHVAPQFVQIHFPSSSLIKNYSFNGERYNAGLVGEFVLIEDEQNGFLARINEVYIPEREREDLSESNFKNDDFHPLGKVELLLAFDHYEPYKVKKGMSVFPQVGSKVYVSSPSFVKSYVERFGVKEGEEESPSIELGGLLSNTETKVSVSQQALFGRHCAVVGTTGGGKSWTLSRLIGGVNKNSTKAIIIDATGEYADYSSLIKNIKLGSGGKYFHYQKLSIDDLFYLLKPSERTQSPKLLEAVRSLKIVALNSGQNLKDSDGNEIPVEDGLLKKQHKKIRPYHEYYYRHVKEVESRELTFDITKLAAQINEECIWPTSHNDSTTYGGRHEGDLGHCVPLISRVNEITHRSEFNNVFGFLDSTGSDCITTDLDNFFSKKDGEIIRIDFSEVKFEFQSREILANAIANYLLVQARNIGFKDKPVVLFVDEAHQFLNKTIKDEYYFSRPLEAFDLIAKECRKYGLFLCLSTQIPRDIPTSTLSQMGTFIAHRLINYLDKEAIANACSSANKNSLNYLPVLGEGEALLTGVDFPMPLLIKVSEPEVKPLSNTPKFK